MKNKKTPVQTWAWARVDGNRTRIPTSYEWAGNYEDDLEAAPN